MKRRVLSAAEVAQTTKETERLMCSRGAESLEFAVIDAEGRDWNGLLPNELRCQATAVFPDGHEVVGESDPYDAAVMIYQTDGAAWTQARLRLVSQFMTHSVTTSDS